MEPARPFSPSCADTQGIEQTVLVIAENAAIEEMLILMLRLAGYHTSALCARRRPAITWVAESALRFPALVLLDVDLCGVLTGSLDFLHLVQAQWRAVAKEIPPMILLTTSSSVGVTLEQEGYSVLAKPFHLKELFDKVKRVMNRDEEVLETGMSLPPATQWRIITMFD